MTDSTHSKAKRPWEARLNEAAARVEREVRQAVRAVDEEVIPELRKHGSSGLRALAAKLEALANSMDDARREAAQSDEETKRSR